MVANKVLSFKDLPLDILLNITDELDHTDLECLRLTCRSLYRFIPRPIIPRRIPADDRTLPRAFDTYNLLIRLLKTGNILHGRTDVQICFYCLKLGEVNTRFNFKLNDLSHLHICHDCTTDILWNTLTRPDRTFSGPWALEELYCDNCKEVNGREDWLEWGGRGGLCLRHTKFMPVRQRWNCRQCCRKCLDKHNRQKQESKEDESLQSTSNPIDTIGASDTVGSSDAVVAVDGQEDAT